MVRFKVRGPLADAALLEGVAGAVPRPEGDALVLDAGAPGAAALAFHAEVHGAGIDRRDGACRIGPGSGALGGHRFEGALTPRWAAIWREAAGEIAGLRGRQTPEEVRARLTMIWCRAESRLRARSTLRPAPSGFDAGNLRVQSVSAAYEKFFVLRDYVYDHDLFSGGTSGPLGRAVMVMADAVTVLPWDPVRDRVLLIEQVRASPVARGDPNPWLLEPVAGRIDPTDTPEAAVHREAWEEARLRLGALHKVGEYYPSTGAFSEYLYSYVGIADLPDGAATLGGLEVEGEDIRGHLMPRAEMMTRIAAGHAPVGPLLLTAFWLEGNAARLRAIG